MRSDGTFWVFIWSPQLNGDGWIVGNPGNIAATFNSYSFIVTFPNGEKRHFDPNTGYLLTISDRNGNTTSLTYDSSGRLSTITDPASRTLTFNYNNATFTNLVTSVSSSVGVSYSYSYDGQGRLSQVTKPDTTTVSFAYDTSSRVTTVTDSNGKTLESHTYDSRGRGLTGSRANGVEAVTLTYPQ